MHDTTSITPADIIYSLLQKYGDEKKVTEAFGDISTAFGVLTERGLAAYLRGDTRKHLRKTIIEYKKQLEIAESYLSQKEMHEDERVNFMNAVQEIQSALSKYKVN